MKREQQVKEKREEILRITSVYGARDIRVFGSVARGEADRESDVDFLVELEDGRSLLDLGGLRMELEESFLGARWMSSRRAASTGSCAVALSRRQFRSEYARVHY